MNIQFLFFEGCLNIEAAYSRLEEVVSELIPGTTIDRMKIKPEDAAKKHNFYGSSSIHIDGVDLKYDPERETLSYCLYGDEESPPKWLIEAVILRALRPKGFLFLCAANSARSQIGEGIARQLAPVGVKVQSAGSKPRGVRPEAITVLSELGINALEHSSKNVSQIDPATVDTIITLCGEEECPLFLGKAYRLHWGLSDPASVDGNQETRLNAFRQVRDELKKRLSIVFAS